MIKKKVILLVEDNPDDEALTIRALNKNNILNEVIVARDGAEALDLLFGDHNDSDEKVPIFPELILLDLNLPKISGLEVLKRIRSSEKTRMLPVVVLTTSNEDRDRMESYALGVNSYIRKPVDFRQFSESILQVGLYWLVLNEGPPQIKNP
jgi:two-component system response regulator